MDRKEHLLTCLSEECAEVAQRVSKALRFGLEEVQAGQNLTNRQRIVEEYHDLCAVVVILVSEGILEPSTIMLDPDQVTAKRAKIERFMAISRREGALS